MSFYIYCEIINNLEFFLIIDQANLINKQYHLELIELMIKKLLNNSYL